MKATCVGIGNKPDPNFNYLGYIQAKYDGLFPNNFPKKADFISLNSQIQHHRRAGDPDNLVPILTKKVQDLHKVVHTTQREWMRQQ